MTISHDAAARAGWPLAAGAVRSLPAAAETRLLLVLCGQVWITECVPAGTPRVAEDHWLAAGQALALPAGTRWIVEAQARHGAVRLVMLEPPPSPPTSSAAGGWLSAAARAARLGRQLAQRAARALTPRPASPAGPRLA